MISIKNGTATYDWPVRLWHAIVDGEVIRVGTLEELSKLVELTGEELELLKEYHAEVTATYGEEYKEKDL
jgi:hypothetical protein